MNILKDVTETVPRRKRRRRKTKAFVLKMIRLRTMTLEEGIDYLHTQSKRKIDGFWVENAKALAATRLEMFRRGQITCVKCGISGDTFHIERHKNNKVMPFSINLYAKVPGNLKGSQMTWDHVIPKSLGGSNSILNAQCMCEKCNGTKGNKLSLKEIIEIVTHPNVVAMNRIPYENKAKWPLRVTIEIAKSDWVSEVPIENNF